MGRAARLKAERRARAAEFEVFCPGVLEVLSIGKGDMKITLDDTDEGRAESRRLIEEMLRLGYSIFVETKDYGPVRVNRFDPKEMTYIVVEPAPSDTVNEPDPVPERAAKPAKRRPTKTRERKVPVAGSKATAVGRTAGG